MPDRYDVLVVGGGPAGCVLAARLSEDPARRVCLVEAGPDYGPFEEGRWPADLLDARELAFSHAWETDREDRSQLRARVIGGCSAHNACAVFAGAPADYDEWGPGWTFAELEPHLRRAETELRTRQIEHDELSPWHAAFVEAAGDDAILHRANEVDGVRWNAAFAYLDPARGRPNLTILDKTLADRLLLDGQRAVGLATAGGELRAGTVVLAAGAYGSPAILLRSGIGPESSLPVGEGLLDHVGVGFGFEPTPRLREAQARFESERTLFMAQVTVRARSNACEEGLWDLFMFPAAEPGGEISTAVFAMKPRSRGSVRLTSTDPRAPLAIDHGFLADQRDAAVLADGVDRVRELVRAEPLAAFAALETRPGPDVTAAQHVRETARGFFHPTGTCALGRVVDEGCRVLGYDGLLVGDASVLPTIPRANTHLSVLAVAERLAELLA
jgi:choline dehydrogenase